MRDASNKLVDRHVRLFARDVSELEKLAKQNGTHFQIELRQLVRRALRGDRREITVVKEAP